MDVIKIEDIENLILDKYPVTVMKSAMVHRRYATVTDTYEITIQVRELVKEVLEEVPEEEITPWD